VLKTVSKYDKVEKFNEDIIVNFRKNDSMVDYLVDVCKALEAVEYIKYDGYEIIENEYEFPIKASPTLPIDDSRLYLAIFKFTLTKDGKVEKVKLPLYLPKLINGYYYILAGSKYYAIYQNVDSATYNTGSCVILKSMLMPIIVKAEKKSFISVGGEKVSGRIFSLNMFKRIINIMYYYFAIGGLTKTLKYFNLDKLISYKGIDDISEDKAKNSKKFLYFAIGKTGYLKVNRDILNDKEAKNYLITILDIFKKRTDINNLEDVKCWKIKLGALFTTNNNNQLHKSKTILISLRRILDDRTKKNLHINEKDKKNIFSTIRWITNNFDTLMNMNNFSLENKRLRLSEYMLTPFTRYMSNKTYRLLNSRTLKMSKIKGIFRVNPMTIISDLQVSDLLRYCNAVNDNDIFNCGVKFSNRGPQALGEGSKKTVSIYYRGIHSSHFGRLSLNSCSSNDPGLSGCLTPFVETHGLYYAKEDVITSKSENEEQLM